MRISIGSQLAGVWSAKFNPCKCKNELRSVNHGGTYVESDFKVNADVGYEGPPPFRAATLSCTACRTGTVAPPMPEIATETLRRLSALS